MNKKKSNLKRLLFSLLPSALLVLNLPKNRPLKKLRLLLPQKDPQPKREADLLKAPLALARADLLRSKLLRNSSKR